MNTKQHFRVTIPRTVGSISNVQQRIEDLVQDFGLSVREIFGIRLAIEEGISALAGPTPKPHIPLSPKEMLNIECVANPERLRIEISRSAKEESIPAPHTQKLQLTRLVMENIELNDNRLVMERPIVPAAPV